MNIVVLFFLGAAVGSFIGVIFDRYREDLPIWNRKIIGGRSHCSFCKRELRWFELVPIFSFVFQKGKCLRCSRRLGWHYPLIEIATGLIFVFVPMGLKNIYAPHPVPLAASVLWISVFSVLFLIFLIDARMKIIPDELEIALFVLGIFIIANQPFSGTTGSFLGGYSMLFGLRPNALVNHFVAGIAAGIFFSILILLTRGRGMGGGDMKLAAAIGWVFGWPDIVLILILSFVIGSIFGIGAIFLKKEKLKSRIAFGPFMASSAVIVFISGYQIMKFYFGFFGP